LKSSSVNKVLIYLLATLFLASGVLHLLNPAAFLWLMPPWLPEHNFLILLSGVFELLCAIGLLAKVKWSGYVSALVLIAIWPANIWYAFDVLNQENTGLMVAAWLRLPLQIPFIYAAIKFARNRV